MFTDGYASLEFLSEINTAADTFHEVILLDLFMPVMTGFEFLDKYAELYSHKSTAIFAMSNSLDKEDQQRANNHMVVKRCVTKPLIYNNIQFIIDTYVESPTDEENKA